MKNKQEDILYHAKRELKVANKAIVRMKEASNFEELEDEWKIYLNSIEKVWVKVEQACKHDTKFQPWQGFYKKQRKKDPLLKYIKHARNSDQHSIQEVMEKKNASRLIYTEGVGHLQGITHHIDKLVIEQGEVVTYKGNMPLIIEDLPHRIELVSIMDSGELYQPPKKHLDKKIPWPAPVSIAELGYKYYENFIDKVEEKFVISK